jgi:hypothetical protein
MVQPIEVFAVVTLAAYLVIYCVAARYLEIRRRLYREQRQGAEPAPNLDLKFDAAVREVGINEFSKGLLQLQKQSRDSRLALTEVSLVNARLILAEHGREALRALERHLIARLREYLRTGALLCVAGEGRILAIHPAPSQTDALSQAQTFCREESENVLVLPEIPKPVALQCRCRSEAIE